LRGCFDPQPGAAGQIKQALHIKNSRFQSPDPESGHARMARHVIQQRQALFPDSFVFDNISQMNEYMKNNFFRKMFL